MIRVIAIIITTMITIITKTIMVVIVVVAVAVVVVGDRISSVNYLYYYIQYSIITHGYYCDCKYNIKLRNSVVL